jgi:hypothetical protein
MFAVVEVAHPPLFVLNPRIHFDELFTEPKRKKGLVRGALQLGDLGGKLALLAIVALRLILCLICSFDFSFL